MVVAITVVLAVIISIMDSAILEGIKSFNEIRITVIVCQKQNGMLFIPIQGMKTKVKANIEKTIENRHLEDQILEVRVPLQDVVEMRNGAAKQVQKKNVSGLCASQHGHE